MERREFLKLAVIAGPITGLVFGPKLVQAQQDGLSNAVENVVGVPTWDRDPEVYFRFRWGAFSYASFVQWFGAPDGNVPQENDDVFQVLHGVLPSSFDNWHRGNAATAVEFAQDNEDELIATLGALQEQNADIYTTWLEGIGIRPSGRVSATILSGQALATVVSLANQGDSGTIDDRIRQLRWCFYPFCW